MRKVKTLEKSEMTETIPDSVSQCALKTALFFSKSDTADFNLSFSLSRASFSPFVFSNSFETR